MIDISSVISDSRLVFIQGKYEESLKLAKQALEMDSKNPDAHQCVGNAYMSFGDYENVIGDKGYNNSFYARGIPWIVLNISDSLRLRNRCDF
ncbi:MAG: tetratricopeptide repeat protein [Ruminococcus sp.]|nr:tetratricopeptide repeat protein [Ruminococcus sp.]